MANLAERMADLTGQRDRDVLDTTLAQALRDLLLPRRVSIYRCVGDETAPRWLTRADLAAGDSMARSDPAWAELSSLPELHAYPHRVAAMRKSTALVLAGPPACSLFALATDRGPVGVLEIESAAPLSLAQQRLVGSILRVFRNFQEVLDHSERDTLTGLLNRKTFDESFYKATAAPAASGSADDERRTDAAAQQVYLAVIDIDHFKRVNDNFGHLIGDEVLLLLSRLMRTSFRYHDRMYRFGGEEFVVLLRCTSDVDAGLALERLRHNTETYAFPQVGQITLSAGYTDVRPGDTPNSSFARADKAVYWSKAHGRNQVASHQDLVRRGELRDESVVGDVELF